MSFPLTAAAAQTETFEDLNEGIWVEESALQNIEASLQANADAVATYQTTVDGLTAQITALTTERDAANATVATRDGQIATLQAEVTRLNAETPPPKQASKDKDETAGGDKIPFHASADDPSNRIADGLMGMPKAKA